MKGNSAGEFRTGECVHCASQCFVEQLYALTFQQTIELSKSYCVWP